MELSQSKIYKFSININYKDIEKIENLFFLYEEILGVSSSEVHSTTIDSMPEDIWVVEAYFPTSINVHYLQQNLDSFANNNGICLLSRLTVTEIDDQDWVANYQKELQATIIGRFYICQNSQATTCPGDKTCIIIEASRAFGTGQHETTYGCAIALQNLSDFQYENIWDIGTGSGILSFISEKLWPTAKVIGCDIDQTSVEIAKINQKFNNSSVLFYQNTHEKLLLPELANMKFDLIVSNILCAPLITLADDISKKIKSGGKLILSGFLGNQLEQILHAYTKKGFHKVDVYNNSNWITLIMNFGN